MNLYKVLGLDRFANRRFVVRHWKPITHEIITERRISKGIVPGMRERDWSGLVCLPWHSKKCFIKSCQMGQLWVRSIWGSILIFSSRVIPRSRVFKWARVILKVYDSFGCCQGEQDGLFYAHDVWGSSARIGSRFLGGIESFINGWEPQKLGARKTFTKNFC